MTQINWAAGPDEHGFFGMPTTCQVCWEPSLPLKHAEVLCEAHALEAGYVRPEECTHPMTSRIVERPEPDVGLFGWTNYCQECCTDIAYDGPDEEEY
jgi:hypothetical protein